MKNKGEVKKVVKKAVARHARKEAKTCPKKVCALFSGVCKKFAKANDIPESAAGLMLFGSLARFAIDNVLDKEIKAGRRVKARRADKKSLDVLAKRCADNEAFRALKVKLSDIPGMDELKKKVAKEAESIDFGEI